MADKGKDPAFRNAKTRVMYCCACKTRMIVDIIRTTPVSGKCPECGALIEIGPDTIKGAIHVKFNFMLDQLRLHEPSIARDDEAS